jgi:peroxiredoxin family protein
MKSTFVLLRGIEVTIFITFRALNASKHNCFMTIIVGTYNNNQTNRLFDFGVTSCLVKN